MSPHSAGALPAAARDPRERGTATVQAREQRNDRRARILDAAVKVFAERGYFSSTVAEIARAAGVADGTIYLYFKSKDDLLLRLFDEKMTQLLAEAKAALAEERDAPSRLKRFIQLHFSLVEKDGQEKGELDPSVSPGTAKRAIFGALDELALGWLVSGRRTSLKKAGNEVAEWLVRGLAPHHTG